MSDESGKVVRLPVPKRADREIDEYDAFFDGLLSLVENYADRYARRECPELYKRGLNEELLRFIVAGDVASNILDVMNERAQRAAASEGVRRGHVQMVNRLLWRMRGPEKES